MSEVQETTVGRQTGSIAAGTSWADGLLEDTYGVTYLVLRGNEVGHCQGLVEVKQRYEFDRWMLHMYVWSFEHIVLSHRSMLLRLHGASIQQLFAPLVVLRASPRPVENPVPGLDDVILAVVDPEVLSEVLLEHPFDELFSFLHARVRA